MNYAVNAAFRASERSAWVLRGYLYAAGRASDYAARAAELAAAMRELRRG